LKKTYTDDLFEAVMRFNIIDQKTNSPAPVDAAISNGQLLPGYKAMYLPRIRCIDCPGKLYTAGPGHSVENFEVHLKNRAHKRAVEKRLMKTGP
jgi:SWI/SNF-related matrix-associated actin-dependent regulator of chromatin subfamily B member 1